MTGAITLLGWVALIAGVSLLLIGWRRSSVLRRDLLRVGTARDRPGVWVRALGTGSVTLEGAEPRQDIGHPGVIGVSWETGYGQAGEVVAVDGLRVTREFRVVQGEPPPVCRAEDASECPRVDLDSWYFPSHPGDAGLEYQETAYLSPLGEVGAWLVPVDGSSRWAVHVHGLAAARRETIRFLPAFHGAGLTSLVIDYRNDPGAPADPSGHYRFGLTEWPDVEAAVRHGLEHGASDVVLVGYSTGGAHVMSFLERSELAESVGAVVLDSPNVILSETVRHGSRSPLSLFGLPIGQLADETGMWIAHLLWGVDWETTNYVERAGELLTMPTLVFHGTSDRQVPISVSRRLEARAATVTLVETPAAGHVMSWNADPARYERHLKGFLGKLRPRTG